MATQARYLPPIGLTLVPVVPSGNGAQLYTYRYSYKGFHLASVSAFPVCPFIPKQHSICCSSRHIPPTKRNGLEPPRCPPGDLPLVRRMQLDAHLHPKACLVGSGRPLTVDFSPDTAPKRGFQGCGTHTELSPRSPRAVFAPSN